MEKQEKKSWPRPIVVGIDPDCDQSGVAIVDPETGEIKAKKLRCPKDCTPNRKRCRRATSRNRRASRGCHRQSDHSWRLHHQGPQHHGTEWIYQRGHQGFNCRKEVNFLVFFGQEVHIKTNKKETPYYIRCNKKAA